MTDPFTTVSGDHTRTIQIATPTVGGLMKFAVKTRTCLGCKTALKPTNSVPGESNSELGSGGVLNWSIYVPDGAVCHNCQSRLPELYHKQIKTAAEFQTRFARLWTQCQRCQGSLHQVSILQIGLAVMFPNGLDTDARDRCRTCCVQARTVQSST